MTLALDEGDGVRDRTAAERRAEDLLRALVDGTAAATGAAFFTSLVQHLARALNVRRVYVAECVDAEHARARAVWMGNDFAPPFEYPVANTPCMKVTQGQTCLYANHVQEYFPHNKFLPTMNAQSYLGIPMWDSAGRVIGHMVLVDDKPMSEDPLWLSVLQTFAARAGAELEREQANERLRQALSEVERLKNQLQAENIYLQEEIRSEHNFDETVGNSPPLDALLRRVERVADTDATVLIQGETGSGKELIARAPQPPPPPASAREGELRRGVPQACSKASSSAMSKARLPAPSTAASAASSWPTAERCSSTKSASCRSRRR